MPIRPKASAPSSATVPIQTGRGRPPTQRPTADHNPDASCEAEP
jgi:hypothetical protein